MIVANSSTESKHLQVPFSDLLNEELLSAQDIALATLFGEQHAVTWYKVLMSSDGIKAVFFGVCSTCNAFQYLQQEVNLPTLKTVHVETSTLPCNAEMASYNRTCGIVFTKLIKLLTIIPTRTQQYGLISELMDDLFTGIL